jgi:protein-S-isoprenylcysteine O-methyltransferase Ste14
MAMARRCMSERGGPWRLVGSLLFLVLMPGTVVGLVPYWLTRWRVEEPFLGVPILRVAGVLMVLAGLGSLIDSFARFVFVGLGTPAPIAPPTRLVVSGQYRHVRNPMYVAILAIVIGQGLVLGSGALLGYAALLWLLFHLFVVLHEEPRLASRFGAPYEVYRRSVRRWWPRVEPWAA